MGFSRRWALLSCALAAAGCAGRGRDPVAAPAGAAPALTAPDGATVRLGELWAARDAMVLVFWSAGCPCVRRYQERVEALRALFPPERVLVVGISSNAGEEYADVLSVARRRGVTIPIYRDEGGAVASRYGARTTPTVVVVDRAGRVRYRGWIDNERTPGEAGREPWLERALAAVLDGRDDYRERTPTYGCVITRSWSGSQRPSPCCAGSQDEQEATP